MTSDGIYIRLKLHFDVSYLERSFEVVTALFSPVLKEIKSRCIECLREIGREIRETIVAVGGKSVIGNRGSNQLAAS